MTEIPNDVMKAAEEIVDRIATQHVLRGDCVADVALSIMAERERCARIAESVGNFGDYKRDELTKDYGQPRFDMMHEIVRAIHKYPIDFMPDGCDKNTTPIKAHNGDEEDDANA